MRPQKDGEKLRESANNLLITTGNQGLINKGQQFFNVISLPILKKTVFAKSGEGERKPRKLKHFIFGNMFIKMFPVVRDHLTISGSIYFSLGLALYSV